MSSILDAPFVQNFIRFADDVWGMGWHERNGGNLSYRIAPEEIAAIRDELAPQEWQTAGISVPDLAGEFFLITAAGSYFRNISLLPENCFGIIEIDDTGENYRVCWGFAGGAHPTSELPTHLMNHEVKKAVTDGANRVIYHAHPANIVALTFVLPLDSETFTRELWEMISECAMVFPEGVGVLNWMVPGGREIAEASARLMRKHNIVVWAHHGVFCAGDSLDAAFGLMHTVEKAAEILVKVRSMVPEKRQAITEDNLKALASAYNLDLTGR